MSHHDSGLFQKVEPPVLERGLRLASTSFILALGQLWSFVLPDYLLPPTYKGISQRLLK